MGTQFERMVAEPTVEDFYKCVFDPGQSTCFAKHAKGTTIYPVNTYEWPEFFSINAIHGTEDLDPHEEYHKKDRPRRADANCVCFRTILLEFDKIPLEEQLKLVEDLKLPYSTVVFSGSKSYHILICLTEPLKTREEYDTLVKRIYKAIPEEAKLDQANKNPSRLSRVPDNYREDKHAKQRLIDVLGRVDNADLERWLLSRNVIEPEPKKISAPSSGGDSSNTFGLYPETIEFMNFGASEGERNIRLFKAAANMFKVGWSFDDVYDRLESVSDLPSREFHQTLKSAYRTASK